MFKDATTYSDEELLRMCQDFFGSVYWAWYEASLDTVGESATLDILKKLSERFAALEVTAMKALWGREFENLQQVTRALDVVHRAVAYEGPGRGSTPTWEMSGDDSAREKIHHCPIYATTPDRFKDKGTTPLCDVYCHNIGKKFYETLGFRIKQDQWLAKGHAHCGYQIGRANP